MKFQPLKKMTPEQVEAAVTAYDNGESLATLAVRHGVTRQSMHDLLKRRTTMRPNLRYGDDNHFYRGGVRADDRAHNAVEAALRDGTLTRPRLCEACQTSGQTYTDGRAPLQAHHADYNRPLDVMWLCKRCHHQWHCEHQAVPVRKAV
jgi:hypothetical protein